MGLTTDAKLQIKSCVVILERLDEKLLSKYSQRYDFNATGTSFSRHRKKSKENISQKGEKSMKSIKKNKLTKRRIKIKSFCDDEFASKSNHKKILLKTMPEDAENEILQGEDKIASFKIDNTRKTSENLKTGEVSRWNNFSENLAKFRENSKTIIECDEISSKYISSKSNNKNSHHEIEIIQEITKPCGFQEEINSIMEQDFEDKYDLREDNEDDKDTVIFEESPRRVTNSEFLDINSKEVKNLNKKFKSKEKMNVTNSDDDLEVFRKMEILTEGNFIEENVTERLEMNVIDYYLKKLCGLVKHLYELCRIILQLKKELPNNNDLAVHFIKVIKTQKENFFNEIDKSQKTIIEYYKKLLVLHGNSANEVISKVGERVNLKAEDVSRIISQCFLVNEICNGKKNNEKYEKQSNVQEPQISDCSLSIVNENLLKLMEINKMMPQLHSSSPSEAFNLQKRTEPTTYIQKSTESTTYIQKSTNESIVPFMESAGKNAINYSQKCSDLSVRNFLPSYDDYEMWKQNSPPVRAQQKNHYRVTDPRLRKPSQHDLGLSHSDSLIRNNQPPNTKTYSFYSENIKPTTSSTFYTNPTVSFPQQKRPCLEPLYLHTTFPNHIQQRSASQECPLTNFGYPAQNISSCFAVWQGNNMQRCSFFPPLYMHNRMIDAQRQVLTSFRESQHSSEHYSNDSSRLSYQKPNTLFESREEIGKHCSLDMRSRREFQNSSGGVPQEVLDPTVPQKLTMKNCRLQPEPTLRSETDGNVLETGKSLNLFQSFKEETKDVSELSKEKSKSRVYFCAQTGCEMPGLRVCKGCQSVIYCSETCQLKHWVLEHKAECYQLRELRGA